MGIFYSASTNAFYDEIIHGHRMIDLPQSAAEAKAGKRAMKTANKDCLIPDDAVEISAEKHQRLLEGQSATHEIVASGGKPALRKRRIDPEIAAALRRQKRDRLLTASDWTQIPDNPLDETQRAAWRDYRGALRDLDMAADNWPTPPDAEDDEEAE